MQTFSIAAGEYEGFSFRVNPVDSSIVEFVHTGPRIESDADDGDHTVISQFKRNGTLMSVTRVPVARVHEVVRNSTTGQPTLPALASQELPEEDTAREAAHPYIERDQPSPA